MLTVKMANELTGGLSKPSKMPGYSYNIPASECIVGTKLRNVKGSSCYDCYALKNRYVFKHVIDAMYRRFDALNNPEWVDAMSFLINHYGYKSSYFRWHDSGDLQSLSHLGKIIEVCRKTPEIKHWLPTREYGIVGRYIMYGNEIPDNLTIRLSALMIDKAAKTKLPLTTSTIHTHDLDIGDNYICPAPTQGGVCGSCRACWDIGVGNVSYHKH